MADRENGKLTKGHKALPGAGRPPGAEGKEKKMLRQLMRNFSEEYYRQFVKSALELEARDFCRVYLDALRYNVAPLQATDQASDDVSPHTIENTLRSIMRQTD